MMKEDNTIHGEIAIDESVVESKVKDITSNFEVVDGIPIEKYEELYDYYVQFGFDALKRKYSLEINRDVFINNCIKYVEKCPYRGRRKENLQICRNMYKEYIENGFESVVEKFNYQHSRMVLVNWFKNLLIEYDSKARMKNAEKEKVERYTKIYEEYKKNGLLNLNEKFGCSSNRRFLLRQFKKYVKDYETVEINFDDTPNDNKIKSVSKFWERFDLKKATLKEMTDYIIEHSDYKTIDRDERRIHYLIYMIVNRVNGKIYVGQHETMNIDDNYMGSGSVLELAKRKHGIENFEKIILFDFKSFNEMNEMEIAIVNDDFRRKTDCVYNRCNGGFDGPNSEYQKEMHRLGLWKKPNEGKIMCHDKNSNMKFFFEDEIPEGWVKGAVLDKELHEKLNALMDELHSLGSNYTLKQGDSVEYLMKMIEQFKKRNKNKKDDIKLWREIFEYYKLNGSSKTVKKFKEATSICIMYRKFSSYFNDELEQYKIMKNEEKTLNEKEIERMKNEMESYGLKRQWDTYNTFTMKRMYNAFLKLKGRIDEKISFYEVVMDECFEHGMSFIAKKYHDGHIKDKLRRFVPKRFKEFMKEKFGEDVEVEENVYLSATFNALKKRKNREKSEKELKRQEEIKRKRVELYNELVSLGSKMKYSDSLALTTIENSIKSLKLQREKYVKNEKYYNSFYDKIMTVGYKEACKEMNYTGNASNLRRRFLKYVLRYKREDF